jgi:pyridoxamine 5'-phosphate oxidase-like protein
MFLHEEFVAVAHRIVWCTVATVDRRGRPRSRLMHPVWELDEHGALHALVTTRPRPLKRAHLAHSPFVSCSYWDTQHDTAVAECHARWLDSDEIPGAWERVKSPPPPVGHDPAAIWPEGPDTPDCAFLELTPWRLSVRTAASLYKGEPPLTWRARTADPAPARRASSATPTG